MTDDEPEIKYEVRIEYDRDTDSPCEGDGNWKVYSFCSLHANYRHPRELMADPWQDRIPKGWLKRKLNTGLAFQLSYHEHSLCMWFIAGTANPPDMEWDGNSLAGFAIWEESASHIGAKTYASRKKDCVDFLTEYTDWCNGNCYFYAIEDIHGKEIETACGFIGEASLREGISYGLPNDATKENTRIVGEAAGAVDYDDIFDLLD
jgi:hypothetical protein